jgi:uncharacterized protein (DUF4213/DUF364 family)
MKVTDESLTGALLEGLPDGRVVEARIGLHWTAVVVEVDGELRCGLAATLAGRHEHGGDPDVPQAGNLETLKGRDLAALAGSGTPTLRSVGVAAINALLPPQPERWSEVNAEDIITALGAGRRVAIVGHFGFVDRLRSHVGALDVLERSPQPGDLPEDAAVEVLPRADVVAITGMTLVNRTLSRLLTLCSAEARILLLGPSTPLSPALFRQGIHILSGAVVTDIPHVLRAVGQGAGFRQIHQAGVRLVSMADPAFSELDVRVRNAGPQT